MYSIFANLPAHLFHDIINYLANDKVLLFSLSSSSLIAEFCFSLLFKKLLVIEVISDRSIKTALHDIKNHKICGEEYLRITVKDLKQNISVFKKYLCFTNHLCYYLYCWIITSEFQFIKLLKTENIKLKELQHFDFQLFSAYNSTYYELFLDVFILHYCDYNNLKRLSLEGIRNFNNLTFFNHINFSLADVTFKNSIFTKFPSYCFKGLPNLRNLNLTSILLFHGITNQNANQFWASATNLRYLTFNFSLSSDLPFINHLNLRYLKIKNIQTRDFKKFDELKNLKRLTIEGRKINKLEPILKPNFFENIKNLEVLQLKVMCFKEIPVGINLLFYLENLDLSCNQISKIENLEELINLKELILFRNDIEKVENLENLKNLETLDLSLNEISISGLSNALSSLHKFKLASNLIGKAMDKFIFEKLPNIEIIELPFNKVFDSLCLYHLNNLRVFDLQFCEKILIFSQKSFDNMQNLLIINLSYCRIENLSFINFFPKCLKDLNLSHNLIKSLADTTDILNKESPNTGYQNKDSGFNGCEYCYVRNLDLSFNLINNFKSFNSMKFPNLKKLNLSDNNIQDLDCNNIHFFQRLEELDLSYNSIVEHSSNVENIIKILRLSLYRTGIFAIRNAQ
ncbi:L domain-like protein [Ascoidea rubescens DSM 1968]|uniref:L domain-like protein n=1 Tax=Ascoidea rubescens DSM 1968 TaxID=1344418 RepID=A0A1D2VDG1_9ASCO|nr:L domain-like protein [Ascoidea rubescens DSM 1968]ODV59497.1 L domain-like protein [Ascoidea rubescens DSM 1968]